MKKIIAMTAAAVLALSVCACGKGSFGNSIDDQTGAVVFKAENAGKGSTVGALGGFKLEEGQGFVVDSKLEKGAAEVKLLDDSGNELFNIPISGEDTSLNGIASGDYSLGASITEDGTTGTITVVPVDEDVYNETGGDLEKTLAQMKAWHKAGTAEEAAKGAGFEGLTMPANDIELENGPSGTWTYKYEEGHVKASGFAGPASLTIDKAVYAGDGDPSGDETQYAKQWTREINGTEVNCYGNANDKAAKTVWVDGNYMYSIVARGQGGEFDTFGLSEADVTALVSAIK